ncbi:MAG TPA: DUF2950 domain-containing protein [Achromobacter sp.]|nr:DUF2950 domain-containing protein [Achromobacter sp.]
MDKGAFMTNAWVRARVLGAATLLALGLAAPAAAQSVYPTSQAAADAFADALATSDPAAIAKVLGPDHKQIVPGGVAQDDIYRFLAAWAKKHEIVADGGRSWLAVGDSGWTMPVPIVQTGKGWRFDPAAGKAEIRRRAIGRNELKAIDTLRALQAAQARYQNGTGKGQYADRLVSQPGATDGLYWPQLPGYPLQAFGPDALAMGPDVPAADAYYGYRYKVLPSPRSYWIVAWPARYGQSGIASFVIGAQGSVHEADLGIGTASRAAQLQGSDASFDNWIDASPQSVGAQ